MSNGTKLINYILRSVELIFSIIAFAVVAEYDGYSKINYMIFTGVTSMVICLVFLVLYMIKADENPTVRLIELIINVLWWIFWFAAAITISTMPVGSNSRYGASCAFAWLTWIAWSVSTVLSFMNARGGKAGPSGGNTPSAPQTNMV